MKIKNMLKSTNTHTHNNNNNNYSGDIYCRRLWDDNRKTKEKRNKAVQVQLESLSFLLKIRDWSPKYYSTKRLQSPPDDDSWRGRNACSCFKI